MIKKLVAILLALALLLSVSGCKAPVAVYTVTFQLPDKMIRQQVPQGQCPNPVEVSIPGVTPAGWTDGQGTPTDPMTTPVQGDVVYTLQYYPVLDQHVPYLFPDENGLICPSEPLTCRQLKQALTALAAEGAEKYFPVLTTEDTGISGESLTEILSRFYPAATVTPLVSAGTVTRGGFAGIMNTLLARSHTKVTLDASAKIPQDIPQSGKNLEAMLEACIPHTEGENGISWSEIDLPTDLEPGLHILDGWLHYVTEDRFFLKDGKVGDLYFDATGSYTSGDPELDKIVADILRKMIQENPDKKDLELLRVAHEYCRDQFKYLRRLDNAKEVGETGWAAKDAKEMFTTGKGNCYNYAAAFWALARGMGYECYAISGTCTGSAQPHGWCLINIDGADYFFDCEWEMAYRTQHDPPRYEMDMFMIPMDKAPFWSYKWTTY